MSMGTPAPALRHWYLGGQRGGGFFAFLVTSTGAPGTTLVVPVSNEAHGSTQKPASSGLPLAFTSLMQRCARCLQSEACLQFFPRPAVRGSRATLLETLLCLVARASAPAATRSNAAKSAFIKSASA